ncbi:MAG: heavy-metal-associated domain-containing protein [Nitrospiraceae bacterium]
MSFPIHVGVALIFGVLLSILPAAAAEEKQVTLMLGGKFCEFYPDNITKALTEVSGVKAVDLKSMKGHAIVTVDPSKTKPEKLTAAVNQVKGSGWHCTAEVMK